MGVDFTQPWFLLLIIPAAVLLAVINGRRRYPPGSRALILGMRALMVLLLVLALARPHVVMRVEGLSVVYLLDESHSVEGSDKRDWINQSLEHLGPKDRAAVVGFGRDTRLLKPFGMERLPSIGTGVDQDFTDIRQALTTAYGLLPGSGGRIVLISDGLENSGDSLALAEMLAAAGIPVDVLPVSVQQQPDVAVSNITLPKNTWPGQQVVVEIEVESTVATEAELALFWGGNMVFRRQVELARGTQAFSVPVEVRGQSLQRVRAVIDPVIDSEVRNNTIDGITFVQAPPRVLVVEGAGGKGLALYGALTAAGIDVDVISASRANLSLVTLAGYRAIFLADVPAYALEEDQHQALETFVRVLGGGLVAVGGRTSFGLGLYQDTLLEQVLPVAMEVEEQEDMPGLDMILVIDRSGSMMGEKLNMAKNAAISALDILKERDRLGIITFDHEYYVDLNLTQVTEKDGIIKAIQRIEIGGGTIIYPALEKAVDMLAESNKAKHIILLSDGVEGSQFSYEGLMHRAVNLGITVSAIALGDDADMTHMDYLAQLGNGRSYFVPEGGDLPGVFVQETVLAGGDWLVEEDFVPALLHPDVRLGANVPGFGGYVASTAKPLAEVLMSTHRDHPLLARWQYGLGRAVAFTSDTYGMWSMDFLAHPGFASLWLDTLNWVAPSGDSPDIALESRLDGAGVEISALTSRMLEEGERLEVTLVGPEGSQQVLELLPAGRGMYTAKVDQVSQGVYLISAKRQRGTEVTSQAIGGLAVPYPPEFQIQRYSGEGLLKALAEATLGRVLVSPEEVFSGESVANQRMTDITWYLLLAGILVWPIDIAIRRLGGLPQRKAKQAKVSPPEAETKDQSDQTMERLLAAKRRHR